MQKEDDIDLKNLQLFCKTFRYSRFLTEKRQLVILSTLDNYLQT